ncbi:hypothetical protein [Lysobacter capsici]|uniref:hypothetical protein n=1 Tax=Lysobacter capsici TaxID=435897 RepID=UPI000B0CF719|nr:hypothetical protein [Lysobacter capsici]
MTDDPYRPPTHAMSAPPASRWPRYLVILSFVQVLSCVMDNAPSAVEMTRNGDLRPVSLLAFVLSGALMLIGAAMLLWRKPLPASIAYAISSLFAALVMAEWRPPLAFTGLGIGLIGVLVGVHMRLQVRAARAD